MQYVPTIPRFRTDIGITEEPETIGAVQPAKRVVPRTEPPLIYQHRRRGEDETIHENLTERRKGRKIAVRCAGAWSICLRHWIPVQNMTGAMKPGVKKIILMLRWTRRCNGEPGIGFMRLLGRLLSAIYFHPL